MSCLYRRKEELGANFIEILVELRLLNISKFYVNNVNF